MTKKDDLLTDHCDIEKGICAPAVNTVAGKSTILLNTPKLGKIIYIGDPMCSWCYGVAKELELLKSSFAQDYDFELLMGGLRPGGGEAWTQTFKDFLRDHWVHIQQKTGQPFSLGLLEKEYFNYDTEPACRAVRVVRDLAPAQEFAFFKAVQYGFYYKNEDPKEVGFYKSICEDMAIDFEVFADKFLSAEYQSLVKEDFVASANMGVRGFPTIVLKKGEQLYLIANGYAEFAEMSARIEAVARQ